MSGSNSIVFMHNISPSWNEEIVALLLNKKLCTPHNNELEIESVKVCFFNTGQETSVVVGTRTISSRVAKIEFASQKEKDDIVLSYQGLVVPLTHGYHSYLFSSSSSINDLILENNVPNADVIRFPSPPLHLQFMALTTKELERRGKSFLSTSPTNDDENQVSKRHRRKRPTLRQHASLAFLLCKHFDGVRPIEICSGILIDEEITKYLLQMLQSIPTYPDDNDETEVQNPSSNTFSWPSLNKQRKGVKSQNYLTLRQKHAPCWDDLWLACRQVMVHVYGDDNLPTYNALAITKNFHGSPHIDQHDQTFQHVIALGDFVGGRLCSELNDETEIQMNIHNRLARMDGRMVHWVSEWSGKERFSVVYYSTDPKDYTPPLSSKSHVIFMQERAKE